jgi:tape measure domain-containing protein
MSTSVDNRVVQMQFNNAQFENGVNQSLKSLKKLDKSLQLQNGTKGLKNVERAANNVDMSNVSRSVDQASQSFSKLEVVGITALANITNSVVNLGKRIASNLISPITSGGLTRALNLEQANFQLEGLGIEKTDLESSYTEVMDAVLGTAYSYDVAAKAASQLAASNIGVTESEVTLLNGTKKTVKYMTSDMTKAILGIAGVASMTSSSFDDISQIFTRIAGQGRVMSNDLNSISARGLNAAATLANYLGVTEAEVRDLVAKGKIDFNTFSAAMTEAFGEHAKDSTKTFTGALEDLKAALSRIGADFFEPYLTAMRDGMNALTPLVDVIHDKIQWALDGAGTLMTDLSKKMVAFTNIVTFASTAVKKSSGIFDSTFSIITNGAKTLKSSGIDGVGILASSLGKSIDETNVSLDKSKVKYSEWTKALREAASKGGEDSATISEYLSDLASEMKRVEKVGDAFGVTSNIVSKGFDLLAESGVKTADAYKIVGDYLGMDSKQVQKALKEGTLSLADFRAALEDYVAQGGIDSNLVKGVMDQLDDILLANKKLNKIFADAKTIIGGFESAFKILKTIAISLLDILKNVLIALSPIGEVLLDALTYIAEAITKLEKANTVGKVTKVISEGIAGVLKGVLLPALQAVGKLLEKIGPFLDSIAGGLQTIKPRLDDIASSFGKIAKNTLGDVFKDAGKAVQYFISLINTGGVALTLNYLLSVFNKLSDFFGSFNNEFLELSGSAFSNGLMKMAENFNYFFESIIPNLGYIAKTKIQTGYIKELGKALLELAIAMKIVSTIEPSRLVASMGAMFAMIKGLQLMLGSLNGLKLSSMVNLGTFVPVIIGISTALLIIAGAIKILGSLDVASLATGTVAMMILMQAMTKMANSLTTVSTLGLKQGRLVKGLTGMVAIAIALKIIASAIVDLAELSPGELLAGGAAIAAMLYALYLFIQGLSLLEGFEKTDTSSIAKIGLSLIPIALAMKMLANTIIELGETPWQQLLIGGAALGAIAVALYKFVKGLSSLQNVNGTALLQIGASMILLGAGIKIVASAVQTLGSMDLQDLAEGMAAFGLALAGFFAFSELSSPDRLMAFGGAFVIFSAGLVIFAKAIQMIGGMSLGSIVKAFATLGIAIAALVYFSTPLMLASTAIAAFGKSLMWVAGAVALFGVGLAAIGAGLTSISVALTSLATSVTSLPVIIESAVVGFINGIAGGLEQLASIIKGIFFIILDTLREGLPEIVLIAVEFVTTFLVTLAENMPKIVEAGVNMVLKLIEGITNAIPELTASLFNLVLTMVTSMTEAVYVYGPQIKQAFYELAVAILNTLVSGLGDMFSVGINIVKGLWNGAKSMVSWVVDKFKGLGKSILKAIKKALGIKSPSRAFAEVGKYSVEGLAQGMEQYSKTATDAATALGDDSVKAMQAAIKEASSVTDTMDSSPTIRPVLDLSDITAGVSSINSMFSADKAIGVSASINRGTSKWESFQNSMLAGVRDAIASNAANVTDPNYNFTTHVELDGREIARGTATYTQQELNKLQVRSNRKLGLV